MSEFWFWLGAEAEAAAVDLETFEQRAREVFELDSTEFDE